MFSAKFIQPEELVKNANSIKIKEHENQTVQFFLNFIRSFYKTSQ